MFEITTKLEDNSAEVIKVVEKENYKNIGHAAASISKEAKASIVTGKKPGPAGKPPRTKRGKLRRAIRYDVNRESQSAVVGPLASEVGPAGAIQEFGETRGGVDHDPRPFMRPALENNVSRFAGSYEGTLTG